MFVEAFHHNLNDVYLDKKHNRRLDRLLYILLKFTRDTAFSRFNKIDKSKATHRVTEIHKRHKPAENMISEGNTPTLRNDKTWLVISQTTKHKKYVVQYIGKCTTCKLR